MQVVWDNLYEVKDLIEIVDLKKVRMQESECGWGCAGFIIRENDGVSDKKEEAQKAMSEAYHGSDYVILTPCYKELTWLYRIMKDYPSYGVLKHGEFDEGFWAACKCFFIMHKTYNAKTLLLFVVDFLASMEQSVKREKENKRTAGRQDK